MPQPSFSTSSSGLPDNDLSDRPCQGRSNCGQEIRDYANVGLKIDCVDPIALMCNRSEAQFPRDHRRPHRGAGDKGEDLLVLSDQRCSGMCLQASRPRYSPRRELLFHRTDLARSCPRPAARRSQRRRTGWPTGRQSKPTQRAKRDIPAAPGFDPRRSKPVGSRIVAASEGQPTCDLMALIEDGELLLTRIVAHKVPEPTIRTMCTTVDEAAPSVQVTALC